MSRPTLEELRAKSARYKALGAPKRFDPDSLISAVLSHHRKVPKDGADQIATKVLVRTRATGRMVPPSDNAVKWALRYINRDGLK